MTDDYARGRCVAITRAGRRCGGPWRAAFPCTFVFDSTTGEGIDGPWVVLCGVHRRAWERRREKDRLARMRIYRGWLGPLNDYGDGTRVWAARTGLFVAAWWWARRQPSKMGKMRRDCA